MPTSRCRHMFAMPAICAATFHLRGRHNTSIAIHTKAIIQQHSSCSEGYTHPGHEEAEKQTAWLLQCPKPSICSHRGNSYRDETESKRCSTSGPTKVMTRMTHFMRYSFSPDSGFWKARNRFSNRGDKCALRSAGVNRGFPPSCMTCRKLSSGMLGMSMCKRGEAQIHGVHNIFHRMQLLGLMGSGTAVVCHLQCCEGTGWQYTTRVALLSKQGGCHRHAGRELTLDARSLSIATAA